MGDGDSDLLGGLDGEEVVVDVAVTGVVLQIGLGVLMLDQLHVPQLLQRRLLHLDPQLT